MCGRYTLTRLADLNLEFPWIKAPAAHHPRYNIAPSQEILAARNLPEPQFELLHWGLIPSWAKDKSIGNRIINARAETLAVKPAFKNALKKRRCLIPGDGFYEWRKEGDGGKTPLYIQMKNRRLFAFAGLWETWTSDEGERIDSCTIITVPPNELLKTIHDRMPAILLEEDQRRWLEPGEKMPEEVEKLLKPYPAAEMQAYPVSRHVNSPASDSADCIEPVESERLF